MSFQSTLRELQHLSPQQWLDRASHTLPHLISMVLVVAIAWELVQLTWLLLDRAPQNAASEATPTYTPPSGARNKGVDVQTIVNAHLFGVPQAQGPADAADAPETQMNLVLSAVLATNDPSKGWAVIGESPQSAKLYAVGGVIRAGARLNAVYADRVILERNGQLEALALPKHSTGLLQVNSPSPAQALNTNRFEQFRQIAETNPTAFTEIIRPQPVFANGVQRGYRVYPGRNRQQFAKLGLQPGDLVLAINGTPLDDPQRGQEIFNTMSSSSRVNVTIERNGQSQDLTLDMAQMSLPEAPTAAPAQSREFRSRADIARYDPSVPQVAPAPAEPPVYSESIEAPTE